MLKIARQTRLKPIEVIERAVTFFGQGGQGLTETQRNACCVSFEGGGGFVSVSITEEDDRHSVDVETREYEYQVKRFLETL